MNFTFVRCERSQEENQERAYIAASRRQDRDFKQRLESLQKASDLHFARTGRRFEITQAQVEHTGPLMELGDEDKRRRESRRYAPYTLEHPAFSSRSTRYVSVESLINESMNAVEHTPPLLQLTRPPEHVHTTSPQMPRDNQTGFELQRNMSDASQQHSTLQLSQLPDLEGEKELLSSGLSREDNSSDFTFFNLESWEDCDGDFMRFNAPGANPEAFSISRHADSTARISRNDAKESIETQTTEEEQLWQDLLHYDHSEGPEERDDGT